MSVGLCLIFFFDNNRNYHWGGHSWDPTESYHFSINELESEIARLKRNEPVGWERRVEELNANIEKFRFVLDNDINVYEWYNPDWRLEYIDLAFEGTEFFSNYYYGGMGGFGNILPLLRDLPLDRTRMKTYIANDDWRGMYEYMVELQSLFAILPGADSGMVELIGFKFVYALENDIAPNIHPDSRDAWKNDTLDLLTFAKLQIYEMEQRNSDAPDDVAKLTAARNEAAIMQYRLDNNISRVVTFGSGIMGGALLDMGGYGYDNSETDVWKMIDVCITMIPFMSVFIIIVAGGLVSVEFSRGTIKFLLITPVKRWKILVSKYAVMLLTGMAFLAVSFGIFFILGGALTGFINMDAVNLTASDGNVTAIPAMVYYTGFYLLGAVNIGIIATLAFALSSVSRNSGLAIAVSIAALIGSDIIDSILRYMAQVDWGRYLLFANANLIGIIHGGSGGALIPFVPYKGQDLTFALVVIAVHMLIFGLMAWDGFTKKEI
jgi:ABC-2 type transport system permease protein